MPLCPICHKEPLPPPFKGFAAVRCYQCGLVWLHEQWGAKNKEVAA